jgi:hypothetical protein
LPALVIQDPLDLAEALLFLPFLTLGIHLDLFIQAMISIFPGLTHR